MLVGIVDRVLDLDEVRAISNVGLITFKDGNEMRLVPSEDPLSKKFMKELASCFPTVKQAMARRSKGVRYQPSRRLSK